MPEKNLQAVDRMVDDVVTDPAKAEELKKVLHAEMEKAEDEVAGKVKPSIVYSSDDDDSTEDFFENMPV